MYKTSLTTQSRWHLLAEGIGFEPMRRFRNDSLANCSLNHSGNLLCLAEDGGVEPHPISENLVFKASRRTIPAASSSINHIETHWLARLLLTFRWMSQLVFNVFLYGRGYQIRTDDDDFKDRCLRPLGETPT